MGASLHKGHLLVVDDEPGFRCLARRLLGREGFQVSEASSGEEALNLLDSGLRVDVLLLDYRMPGLNGGETLDALRRKGIDVPAVLISAAAEIYELAAQYGFNGAISKPCSTEAILQVIEPLLSHSQSPSP
jgi:CheY-like chemotaxis protein